MKAENKGLWKKWVAFRDKGTVGEAFVMGQGGKWFTEGHRGVWREIWKRGVCSGRFLALPILSFRCWGFMSSLLAGKVWSVVASACCCCCCFKRITYYSRLCISSPVPELWNLPPAPPAPHTLPPNGESLVHPARARYLAALDAHKAWRRTLRCSDPARLNEYEDVWYPHYLLEARRELLDQNPHGEVEQDAFRRVEEHFALLQFQLVKSLTVKDEFRFAVQGDGGWVRRKGLGEQVHDVEMAEGEVPWDMSFVREENERQDERERGEYAERRRKRQKEKDQDGLCRDWLQWYQTLAWTCRGLLDMPVLRRGRGNVNTADVPCLVEAVSRLSVFWDDSYQGAAADGVDQPAEDLPAVLQEMDATPADPFVPTDDALEGSRASPAAKAESVLSGSEDGVAIAPTRRTHSPAQAVAQQSLHTTDAQVRPQSPEHEEFLRRCTRSGVVVTAPRTDSPARPTVQESDEITPFSHRHWYEEFMDYPIFRRIRIRRIPGDMAPWR